MVTPTEVSRYWLDEVGVKGWYRKDEALDEDIRTRFFDTWAKAEKSCSAFDAWTATPEATLGFLILLDQFPRNVFRNEKRAFATDASARAVAKKAIDKGWDLRIPEPQRQFFYTPMMHSECLSDQDRCIRLMKTRMTQTGAENLVHAKAHREIIRRFGRFPARNAALGRACSAEEAEFLRAQGGYGAIVNGMRAAS